MASFGVVAATALILLAAGSASSVAADQGSAMAVALETGAPSPKAAPAPMPKLTAAERCTSLQQQFGVAALLHLTAKKLASARKLAEDGAEDCANKKYSLGTRRYVEALAALGVTPRL